jgi:hypothetical protein
VRRLGGLLVLALVLGGCGEEVAPRAGGTPSLGLRGIEPSAGTVSAQTPGATQPVRYLTSPLPQRPELPASAYQQISVIRLQAPNTALLVPPDGYAQVISACTYEE